MNTKEAPAAPPEPAPKIDPALLLPNAVVAATNVPIGYYESVISKGGNGKVLTGWRYIGLTTLGGGQAGFCREDSHAAACKGGPNGCITGPLYGLVFFNGVMTFRQLDEIANNQLCPMYVNPTATAPGPAGIDRDRSVDPALRRSVSMETIRQPQHPAPLAERPRPRIGPEQVVQDLVAAAPVRQGPRQPRSPSEARRHAPPPPPRPSHGQPGPLDPQAWDGSPSLDQAF